MLIFNNSDGERVWQGLGSKDRLEKEVYGEIGREALEVQK